MILANDDEEAWNNYYDDAIQVVDSNCIWDLVEKGLSDVRVQHPSVVV